MDANESMASGEYGMTTAEIIKGLKAVRTIHNGNYAPFIDEAIKKLDALDKIRAAIAHLTITEGGEDYTRKMAELYSLKIKVLQIIDKYMAESEEIV